MQLELLRFDRDRDTIYRVGSNPTVDAAAIVPDQIALTLYGFDQVQVVPTADADKDDRTCLQIGWCDGFEGDERAVAHLALHRVASWPDLGLLTSAKSFFCVLCPTHDGLLLVGTCCDLQSELSGSFVPALPM